MPQKKNPYALEYLRGLTATLHASLLMALSLLKAPSEELDLMIFQPRLFEALEQAARAATLAARVVDGLNVDTRRMAELAATDLATATDLADRLSQRFGLAFRTTHRIVGTAIRLAADAPLTPELIDAAAREVTGAPLAISRDELDRWLDVTAAVAGRSLEGGPAPHAVRAQLTLADTLRLQSLAGVQQRRSALAVADKRLGERARALADQA
ncbi:MAG TPA: hypothetical protein VF937_04900, partial [Chloroflexota bacterium]